MVNYNFRELELSTRLVIHAGKSADQNDLLVKSAKRNDLLLHTSDPGSPFVNLGENPAKNEIKEAAVFCALKSKSWRDNPQDIIVHSFFKRDCSKGLIRKAGSWNVRKTIENIKVKKPEIVKLSKELEDGKTN